MTVCSAGAHGDAPAKQESAESVRTGPDAGTMGRMQPPAEKHVALTTPFVGRDREFALLTDALDRAPPHGVTLWIIRGEPGIGKTRLARELTAHASARGWRTVWSQGFDGSGVPPYWPWAQVVRDLRGHSTGTRLAAHLHLEDGPTNQFELFDATVQVLDEQTQRHPLLVVLDDIHLMDADSLQLLEFVASHGTTGPMLVVGTRRIDGTARPSDDVLDSWEPIAQHLPLAGLSTEGVAALLGGRRHATEALAITAGNPLFVEQILRAQRLRDAPLDDGTLADATRSRFRALDPQLTACLVAVSLLGRHARVRTVADVLGRSVTDTRSLLAEAVGAGLLTEVERPETAHPLFAVSAEELLTTEARESMHHRAADLLASLGATASEIAGHLVRAGAGHRRAAVAALTRAGHEAAETFAYHSAVEHHAQAAALLEAVESPRDADFRLRCEATLALAGAQGRADGRAAAEDTYVLALDLAERTTDPALIARAAARHGIEYFTTGDHPGDRAATCRQALELLPPGDSALRASLLAQVAAAGLAGIDPEENRRTACEAEAMARRVGDATALGLALVARQVGDLGPASLAHRLDSAREILELAERTGDPDLAIHGRFLLKAALLEKGELRELEARLNEQRTHIGQIGAARWSRHWLWFRCTQAMLDGDPERVEEVAGEIGVISDRLKDPDGIGVFFGQLGVARWLQGRLAEMEDAYLSQFRSEPDEPLWPTVLAWLALQDGRLDVARGWASHFRRPALVPEGMHTLLTLVNMADVVAEVGHDDEVREIWEALLPYADHVVPLAMGAGIFGTVARPLGRLAARMGRLDEAVGHYERSIAVAGRIDARAWLVDAQLELAELLIGVANEESRARAADLVAEAGLFSRPGATVFDSRLARLRGRLDESPAAGRSHAHVDASRPITAVASHRPTVRIDVLGAFEVRALSGQTARWTSRKARILLKLLVARAGGVIGREEVMAVLWPDTDPAHLANRLSVALSTVRRTLDPQRVLAEPLVASNDEGLWLAVNHREVDVEVDALVLLDQARSALGDGVTREQLHDLIRSFTDVPFADDPFADWARPLREEVTMAMAELLRRAIDMAAEAQDHFAAAESARRLIDIDPFDEAAHHGRISALHRLGAHGRAAEAEAVFAAAMAEVGLAPVQRRGAPRTGPELCLPTSSLGRDA